MLSSLSIPQLATSKAFFTVAAFLALLLVCQARASADTLVVSGNSNSQNPLTGSTTIGFLGQSFNNNFNVTASGQIFDFTFGQFQIQPGTGGFSGCSDPGGCLPITLTGTLTSPVSPLSFSGLYEDFENDLDRELFVFWNAGINFAFTTAEGGFGTFSLSLLNFSALSTGGLAQLSDQLARITITAFTPSQAPTPIPEPATLLLFTAGILGVGAHLRRRKS